MSSTITQWQSDMPAIKDLNTMWNVTLSVVDGHLHLEKGTSIRRLGTPIIEDLNTVSHINSVIKLASEKSRYFQEAQDNTPEFYEQTADFVREVKILCKKLRAIQHTYRMHDVNDSSYDKHFSRVYDTTALIREALIRKKHEFTHSFRI